ncbi:MAG TPA: AAA family ATPase [Thermodesulfobacteriota bacterium]|nr:AAA family ATPase [Thermodesulfobacteriota bacterium]
MTDNGLQSVEKRENPRKDFEAPLIVNPVNTPYRISGWVQNISLSGIKVKNGFPPLPSEEVEEVNFLINKDDLVLEGIGEVVWASDSTAEIGIKFTQLAEETRKSLEELCQQPSVSKLRFPLLNEFYHFSENPFNLAPDPRFLFLAISHYDALSSMISGIRERKGITVLTGEVGTGKTTLIYALLKDLSEKIKMAFVFYAKTSFQDLLRNILTELEVPVLKDNLTTLLMLFRQYLKERMVKDETVAIIIDEAQDLEIGVMEDLFRLCSSESPAGKMAQILFVGQPELIVKLDSPNLHTFKDRLAIRNCLKPLDQEECEKYIDHRLKVAGSSSSEVFTPKAIDRIRKFSGGIPRVINILCDRALLTGYTTSTRRIDEGIVKEAIGELGHLVSRPAMSMPRVQPRYAVLAILILTVLGLGTFYLFNRNPNVKLPEKKIERTVSLEARLFQKGNPTQIVSIKKGWTLSFLAQQYYNRVNPTLLDLILEFNPQITDLNLIFVNQQITIPTITEELLLIQRAGQRYGIYLGTFSDEESAHSLRENLVLKGKSFLIIPRKVSPQHTWFRVLAGEFTTREEGLETIRTLRQQGLLPAFGRSS